MPQKTLEERNKRLEDIREVKDLMSRYTYLQWAGKYEEIVNLFHLSDVRVRAEIDNWGVYEGAGGIKRLYQGVHKYLDGDHNGTMFLHTLTSPCIEIAGDSKTARGTWISPGFETFKYQGELRAFWSWWKYGVDFIKDNGKWKIWHLLMCGMFRSPYEKSWVEAEPVVINIPDNLKADRPTTYHWMWAPNLALQNVPEPPEPYETFRESKAYVK